MGEGESLDELQGALLTAGLAAKLERRPCESELLQVLERAAGEPELPDSICCKGAARSGAAVGPLMLIREAAAAQRPSRQAACLHRRH